MAAYQFFNHITLAPKDPILGMTELFLADTNPQKINLGVGVYSDENGKVPVLRSVQAALEQLKLGQQARTYLPIDGLASFNQSVQQLLLGSDATALQEQRVATVQTLGGTGALRIALTFVANFSDVREAWISAPSWENHRALLQTCGFAVNDYPYYDDEKRGIDFDAMYAALSKATPGALVVLHACCHNPTGADLNSEQWQQIIDLCHARGLIPLLDSAYQGFAAGVTEDAQAIRAFAHRLSPVLVAQSFSKSFSLYGDRIGALSVICDSADAAKRSLSQLKIIIRTNYSNPALLGAQIVSTVLRDSSLQQQWFADVTQMRERIRLMREQLTQGLNKLGNFSHIAQQRGMFSYSGLNAAQMQRLRSEHSVYGLDSGRICVAALNQNNIERVIHAIQKVL